MNLILDLIMWQNVTDTWELLQFSVNTIIYFDVEQSTRQGHH